MKNTIRLVGSIELTELEIELAYERGHDFLVGHRQIWRIKSSLNAGFAIQALYRERGKLPLMPRGRHAFIGQKLASELSEGFILPPGDDPTDLQEITKIES